jgi:phage terminase large subunit
MLRTTFKAIIDYNPSFFSHWIYDEVLIREDCKFSKVTYKDNPFLSQDIIKEIERYKDIDENLWKVYGLGERGASIATIFPKYGLIEMMPDSNNVVYGLDFGFNHATALTRCIKEGDNIYIDEILYEKGLTTSELIKRIKERVKLTDYIYCDYSRPEIIKEMTNEGLNARNADKSVLEGIKFMKEHNIFIPKSALNLIREFNLYKWKQDSSNNSLEEPLKLNDDLIDSARYALYTHYKGIKRVLVKRVDSKENRNTTAKMVDNHKGKYKIQIR